MRMAVSSRAYSMQRKLLQRVCELLVYKSYSTEARRPLYDSSVGMAVQRFKEASKWTKYSSQASFA